MRGEGTPKDKFANDTLVRGYSTHAESLQPTLTAYTNVLNGKAQEPYEIESTLYTLVAPTFCGSRRELGRRCCCLRLGTTLPTTASCDAGSCQRMPGAALASS